MLMFTNVVYEYILYFNNYCAIVTNIEKYSEMFFFCDNIHIELFYIKICFIVNIINSIKYGVFKIILFKKNDFIYFLNEVFCFNCKINITKN